MGCRTRWEWNKLAVTLNKTLYDYGQLIEILISGNTVFT